MRSANNPQIRDTNSPLSSLIRQALRRFGDMHPDTTASDVSLMFLEFANEIVEEVRAHPYHDGTDINYYESIEDAREIPDQIIVSGLVYHYAEQQGSQKIQLAAPRFYRTLNRDLYNKRYGNGRPNIIPVDYESEDNGLNSTITSTAG